MTGTPKKRVLIIDDELDVCRILKSRLEVSGFEVSIASDGAEGFLETIRLKPDAVLLDVRMPGEDGLTYLRKLRAFRDDDPDLQSRLRRTPVIILTGAGENMRALFLAEGITDYIEKPFDSDILQKQLHKIL